MKPSKRMKSMFLSILVLGMVTTTMSGCAYANNKSWGDMTPEKQEEVRQSYEEIKGDLEKDFSGNTPEDKFVRYILDKVEDGIDYRH